MSLLRPPNYIKDFILYMAASKSTIGAVLVWEDDKVQEEFIFYISRALAGTELRYSHVDKLALDVVYVIQRLWHYILLRTTIVVVDVNPFQYVLSQRIIKGKFNKWIFILQEFDL